MYSDTVDLMLKYSSVLIFDYTGYGKSLGTPSEDYVYSNSIDSWSLLINKYNYDPNNIIIVGVSLGCTFASNLASYITDKHIKKEPKLVILQSRFYNLLMFYLILVLFQDSLIMFHTLKI